MKKKLPKVFAFGLLFLVLLIFCCHYTIEVTTKGKVFDSLSHIPKNRVGLVLGTSNRLSNGQSNPYYEYRIEATLELFNSGKIEYVLVSGDNGSKYYNEPTTYKKDLVARGIPESKIFLDYAGFRTLDSMVRAKVIFGLDSVTIISQEFHNERAIYLAEKKGLKAIGYNAKTVEGSQGIKLQVRESLARVKVFIDLFLNTPPKFYGEKIEIE